MGKYEHYEVDGKRCWASNIGDLISTFFRVRDSVPYCPVCQQHLKLGDSATLALSNFKLFPNTVLHSSCFAGEETMNFLANNYLEYKKAMDHYKHWVS